MRARKEITEQFSGLHYALKKNKMTDIELARRIGHPNQTIGKLRIGDPKRKGMYLTPFWAEKCAPELGYTPEELIYWDEFFDEDGNRISRDETIRARLRRFIHDANPKIAAQLTNQKMIREFLSKKIERLTHDIDSLLTEILNSNVARNIIDGRGVHGYQPSAGIKNVAPIPIIGIAEAGAFRAMDEFPPENERDLPQINAPLSDRFPSARHFAFSVRGDSMNASTPPIQEGAYLLCVDMVSAELIIESGQIYVVRQTRDGGQTFEWTVKRAQVFRDRIELNPESTNQAHKKITIPRDHDRDQTNEVIAIGWVYRVEYSLES